MLHNIPVISKTFEIILTKRLSNYLKFYDKLNALQFSFRMDKSPIDALIKIVSEINEGFERRDDINLPLCDLSKALECVDHKRLSEKMRNV